ncbi:MAG: YDG domain-containing protein [Lachnospiraceae bacterium]
MKQKQWKRVLSFMLCFLLTVGMIPSNALGAEINTEDQSIVAQGQTDENSDSLMEESSEEMEQTEITEVAPVTQEVTTEIAPATEEATTEVAPVTQEATTEVAPVTEEAPKEVAFHQTENVDGVQVSVTADEGVFPEGATLSVEKVSDEATVNAFKETVEEQNNSDSKIMDEITKELKKLAAEGVDDFGVGTTEESSDLIVFDITIKDKDGAEIQPDTEKGQTKVSFSNINTDENTEDIQVFHADNDLKNVEELSTDVDVNAGNVEVNAEHFSYYCLSTLKTGVQFEVKELKSTNAYLNTGIYYLKENLTFNGSTAESGLKINSNQVVYIYIPSGITLTAKGGNASGTSGGGAGIELPSGAKLVFLGEGKVVATGGKAANGQNGEDGRYAYTRIVEQGLVYSGKGGDGGYGGGGAGAGIGTKGGTGGYGAGKGGASKSFPYDDNGSFYGIDGAKGASGSRASAMGDLYKGSVQFTVTGGEAGTAGGSGGNRGTDATYYSNGFVRGIAGGAGGGGGGAGYAGASIGKGGTGGSQGGGGGSAAYIWGLWFVGGGGGGAGYGAVSGTGGAWASDNKFGSEDRDSNKTKVSLSGTLPTGGQGAQAWVKSKAGNYAYGYAGDGGSGGDIGNKGDSTNPTEVTESQNPYSTISFQDATETDLASQKYYTTKETEITIPEYNGPKADKFIGWMVEVGAGTLDSSFGEKTTGAFLAADNSSFGDTTLYKPGTTVKVDKLAYGNVTMQAICRSEVTIDVAAKDSTYNGNPYPGYEVAPVVTGHEDLNDALVYEYTGTTNAGEFYISNAAPTEAGDYELTIHVPYDNEDYYGRVDLKFTIQRADVQKVNLDNWTYKDAPKTPSVEAVAGSITKNDVVYTYKNQDSEDYTDVVPTNIGTHKVKATIAKTSNYNSGEVTADFTIHPKSLKTEMITLTPNHTMYEEGTEVTPVITVTDDDNETLTLGKDYEIVADESTTTATDSGEYKITISGKGNYGEKAVANWEIERKTMTPSVADVNVTYDRQYHSIAVTNIPAGAKITYRSDAEASESELGVMKGEFSKENPSFNEVREFSGKVRAYTVEYKIEAPNYYDYISQATITINPREMKIRWRDTEFTYDGEKHLPIATAFDLLGNDVCLVEVDGEQTQAGIYTATAIKLNNKNYKLPQDAQTTFTINKKPITISEITAVDRDYDGTVDVELEYGELENIVSGDYVRAYPLGLGEMADKNVGTDKSVTLPTIILYGSAANNYELVNLPQVKVNITPRPAEFAWSAENLTYTGKQLHMDAVVANKALEEDTFSLVLEEDKKTEVGEYTAKVVALGNDNYTLEGSASAEKDWSISYLEAPDAVLLGTEGDNDWHTSGVVVIPVEPKEEDDRIYQISTDEKNWVEYLEYSAEGEHTVEYYLKDTATGYITDKKTVSFKIDTELPTGEIKVGNSSFKTFLQNITFGYLFKDTVDVKITAEDAMSGVAKIEYVKVDPQTSQPTPDLELTEGDSFTMNANDKSVIYAVLTDEAGNRSVINSDGVVVYKDSKAVEAINYIKSTQEDVIAGLELNGNTVASIKVGDTVLTEGKEYIVNSDGNLVFNWEYLDTFQVGQYPITVSYNALGEADYIVGEKPKDSEITLIVSYIEANIEITNDISKIYDGKPVDAPTYTTNSDGTVKIQYLVDGVYTDKAPAKAGEYKVKITVLENENYSRAFTETDFTIKEATPVIELSDMDVFYNRKPAEYSASVTLVNNEEYIGEISYSYKKAGSEDEYTEGFPVVVGEYEVKAEIPAEVNYTAASKTAKLTIKTSEITISGIEAINKVYDGNTNAELDYSKVVLDGIIEGDEVSVTATGSFESKAAGNDKKVFISDLTLSGEDASNYKLAADGQQTETIADIAKKEITVTITPNGGTYGQEILKATAVLNDVVEGDEVPVKLTYTGTANDGTDIGQTEEAPTLAGTYTVTATIDNENYELIGETSAEFIVNRANPGLSVTAVPVKVYYDPNFTLEVSRESNETDPVFDSSNRNVATVDENGKVYIQGAGETTISVSMAETANYLADTKEVAITIKKKAGKLEVEQLVYNVTYGDPDFVISVIEEESESNVTFASDNDEVVTVDETGKVHIVGAGEAQIKVELPETEHYAAVAKTVIVNVAKAQGEGTVLLPGWTYDPDENTSNTPAVASRTNGVDHVTYLYKVKGAEDDTYVEKRPIDAGNYTLKAIFAATSNYLEVVCTTDFVIEKAKKPANTPEGENAKLTAKNSDKTAGDVTLPKGWSFDNNDAKLIPGGVITVGATYSDTKNYKEYKVEIQISQNPELIVNGTDTSYTIGIDKQAVIKSTGAASELKAVLVDNEQVEASNYEVADGSTIVTLKKAYLDTLSEGNHKVTLSYTVGSVDTTLKVNGHEWSKDWTYDETEHWHECVCGEKNDVEEHILQWIIDKEPVGVETGSRHQECEVCGYKGEAVEIPAKYLAMEKATIEVSSEEQIYSGTEKQPAVKVTDGEKELEQDVDYTVTYRNNINAGTATVEINGIGKYLGTVTKEFTIEKASIGNYTLTLSATKYSYSGSAKKPSTTVKDGSKTLKKDTDYTVSYKNNTNIGFGTVTVSGTGNYTGTLTAEISISPAKPSLSGFGKVTSGLTVNWSKVAGATGYEIYRSQNGGTYKKVKTITSGTTKSWTDTGATKNGAKYSYQVLAYAKVGSRTIKGSKSSSKSTYRLDTPTIRTLTSSKAKTVTATWNSNKEASGYYIQYSTTSNFSNAKYVDVKGTKNVSKAISKLTSKRRYYVRMRSYKTVGGAKYNSAWSTVKSVVVK